MRGSAPMAPTPAALALIAVTSCAPQPAVVRGDDRATGPVSRYVEVLGSRMHYLELGAGRPILLLHGQPTSSFLWRRIIPGLSESGRVIAPDLIGFGRSDRPELAYEAEDHTRYLEAFIEALGLTDLIIAGHDWGSYLGAQYAVDHRDRVRGLVFMEAIFARGGTLSATGDPGVLEARADSALRTIVVAARADSIELRRLIEVEDAFVERFLPFGTMRRLTDAEMAAYREPFLDPSDRRPVAAWPRQIMRGAVGEEILRYTSELETWSVPKLLLTVTPGVLNPESVVAWARTSLPELTIVDLGLGLHFVQEDHPEEIASAMVAWIRGLEAGSNP